MEVDYVLNKLKNLTSLECLDYYKKDIEKLVECQNKGEIYLHTRMKLLSKQISLGLPDPYDRIMKLIKYGRDSSSLEACKLRYGDIEGIKFYNQKKSKSKQTLEKYIQKYGEIDGKIKYKNYCRSKSMSLEMCIKRHGEIEGIKVYEKFWKNTGFGTSKRAFKKRHGDNWEKYYNEFVMNQGKNNTLEGKILKYGEEEGIIKYRELNEKKSKSSNKENFVKKLLESGHSFNEIQNMVIDRWDNVSLKSFISRYGEIDGKMKYNEYIKNVRKKSPLCLEYYEDKNIDKDVAFEIISEIQWKNNKKISRYSKESLKYFDILNKIFQKRGYNCLYKGDELGIKLTKEEYDLYERNRLFFYDFFIPDINLIIEYHGVRFHDDIDYDSTLNITEEEIKKIEYNRDFYKKWIAEFRGYKVIILRSWVLNKDLSRLFKELNFTEEEKCKLI
jgi:hypothetical protein